jgi:hypothetical protein
VQLGAAATTVILHPFASLLDNVLVGQFLEVGIDIVGINIHYIGITETGDGVRGQRHVVTSSTCLALVVMQVSKLQINRVAIGFECGIIFSHN